jgi:hypothetical protein
MNKDGGLFPLPNLVNPMLQFPSNVGPRDRDKQILGRFFVKRLRMLLVSSVVNVLTLVSRRDPWRIW